MRARGLTFSLSAPSCVGSAGYIPRVAAPHRMGNTPAIVLILAYTPKPSSPAPRADGIEMAYGSRS